MTIKHHKNLKVGDKLVDPEDGEVITILSIDTPLEYIIGRNKTLYGSRYENTPTMIPLKWILQAKSKSTPPRYDDVFYEGVDWLDEMIEGDGSVEDDG